MPTDICKTYSIIAVTANLITPASLHFRCHSATLQGRSQKKF